MFPKSNSNSNSCNADFYKSKRTKDMKEENINETKVENKPLKIKFGGVQIKKDQSISPTDANLPISFCWSGPTSDKSILYLINENNEKIYFYQINVPGFDIFHGDNIPIQLSDGTSIKYRHPIDEGKYRVFLFDQINGKKINPDSISSVNELIDNNVISLKDEFSFTVSKKALALKSSKSVSSVKSKILPSRTQLPFESSESESEEYSSDE